MRPQRSAVICLVLGLVGLALSVYLTFIHLALLRGELAGGAACGEAGTIFNCHAVTASPLAVVLGIPLALWGCLGYVAVIALSLIASQVAEASVEALEALAAVALLFVALDAGLLIIMLTRIKYLCPLCLATYAVNLGVLLAAWWGSGRSLGQWLAQLPRTLQAWLPRPGAPAVWMLWIAVLVGGAGIAGVQAAATYMNQGAPGSLRTQMRQFITQQQVVSVQHGTDPTIGAANPAIEMVEFSDFLCPSCQRASKFNPLILAGYRDRLAFTFKHYPLDQECNTGVNRTVHQGACRVAAATECAHEQGKFWALHDAIFEPVAPYKVEALDADAARAGLDMGAFRACMDAGRGMEAVKQDVAEAIRLGVTTTPTYFINGVRITGTITPATFHAFVKALESPSS